MKKALVSSVVALAIAAVAVVGNIVPVYADDYLVPTVKEECKSYGWETLVDDQGALFKNQGDCVSFVVPNRDDVVVD